MKLATVPNFICLLRIALTVPIVVLLAEGRYDQTLVLFAIAAVSDILDGYLAKTFGWTLANPNAIKMILSACELVVVGAIVFTHLTFYRESASTSRLGNSAGGSGSGRLP